MPIQVNMNYISIMLFIQDIQFQLFSKPSCDPLRHLTLGNHSALGSSESNIQLTKQLLVYLP